MICHDYIVEYIRKTEKRNKGILHELEQYAEENGIPVIQPETARLLAVLESVLKPKRILEVGTAIGYSAILMASVLEPGGRIDTIDRHEHMVDIAKENIKRAGYDNIISIIAGDALEVLKLLEKNYDMIFLDAAKGQYAEFLPECLRMLSIGGLLISDNVLYKGMVADDRLVVKRKKTIVQRMRSYLDSICHNDMLETSIIPIGDGLAVSCKITGGTREMTGDGI